MNEINSMTANLKKYDEQTMKSAEQVGGAFLGQGYGAYRGVLSGQIESKRNELRDVRQMIQGLSTDMTSAYNALANVTSGLADSTDEDIVIPTVTPTYTLPSGGSGGGNNPPEKHQSTYLEKAKADHDRAVLLLQIAYAKGEKDYEQYITAMESEDKRYYNDVTTNTKVGEDDRLKLQKEYGLRVRKQEEF